MPAKEKKKERSVTRELHEWSVNSDVEQPHRQFVAYEEAPPPPKPAPREPCAQAEA